MKQNNGAFLIARKLLQSNLWAEKPSTWTKIFIYILSNVNHSDNGRFKRGQGFFNFSAEKKFIGIDITDDVIKKFISFARESGFLSTTRSTRGNVVTVLNYNHYQQLYNYSSTTNGTREAREEHERSTPIHKNERNETNGSNNTFVHPTIEDVKNYCIDRNNSVNPEKWFSYYESNGWKVGRNKMKNWQAAVRTWEKNSNENNMSTIQTRNIQRLKNTIERIKNE